MPRIITFAPCGLPVRRWPRRPSISILLTGSGNHIELTACFRPTPIDADPDSAAAVAIRLPRPLEALLDARAAPSISPETPIPAPPNSNGESFCREYVMAVHDAGSFPPQETGLGVNSWYGKFHMEMYWWHAAHWALWGRPEISGKEP